MARAHFPEPLYCCTFSTPGRPGGPGAGPRGRGRVPDTVDPQLNPTPSKPAVEACYKQPTRDNMEACCTIHATRIELLRGSPEAAISFKKKSCFNHRELGVS